MSGELNFRDLYLLHAEMRKQAVWGGPSAWAAKGIGKAVKGVGKAGVGLGKRVKKKPMPWLFGGLLGAELAASAGVTAKNMWRGLAGKQKFSPTAGGVIRGSY